MSKTRTYTITAGIYDSYDIRGRIEGPAKPALSTLYKQFKEAFGYPAYPPNYSSVPEFYGHCKEAQQARARMKEDGLASEYHRLSDYFINWLIREHGFTSIPSDEFHVED